MEDGLSFSGPAAPEGPLSPAGHGLVDDRVMRVDIGSPFPKTAVSPSTRVGWDPGQDCVPLAAPVFRVQFSTEYILLPGRTHPLRTLPHVLIAPGPPTSVHDPERQGQMATEGPSS